MNKKLIRLTESDLHRIVKESVKRVLNEDVRTYSADELRQKWNDTGNSYKYAHPTRNGIDMYTLSNGNYDDNVYFHNKAEALDWIKRYVTDPESIQALKDALSQYRKQGAYINQTSSNLNTHSRYEKLKRERGF